MAALPTEPARAFAQAVDQVSVAVGHASLGIDGGLVADPQLDRVHPERIGQLIHRRLHRQQPRRLARRADVFTARQVERRQAMAGQPVGCGVQAAGGGAGLLGVLPVGVGVHGDLVGDRRQPSVAPRAQPNPLA
jgi:hypothetical protein